MPRLALATLMLLSLLLSACSANPAGVSPQPAQPELQPTLPPAAGPSPTPAATETPSASATPTLTATPAETAPPVSTATPRASQTPESSATPSSTPPPPPKEALAAIIAGPDWSGLGLPQEQTAAWEAYAAGESRLELAELRQVNDFLARWRELQALADKPHLPGSLKVMYRALESQDEDGKPLTLLYPVDAEGRPLLVARDENGKAAGLVTPPPLDGFEQRISPDGRYVQYVDIHPGKTAGLVRLYADAAALDKTRQEILVEALADSYPKNSPYTKNAIFPRFYFPVNQVDVAFLSLEKTLSYQQIVHMNEAFELFDRPELRPLKTALFGRGTSVIVVEDLYYALGLTYTGSKVMAISRKELLGNRYEVAQVLAHEAAHVVQGALPEKGDKCEALLRMEVGDQTIPEGFTSFSASQVLDLLRTDQIGAYHISLWTLAQLGVNGGTAAWVKQVILTGSADGESIVYCK